MVETAGSLVGGAAAGALATLGLGLMGAAGALLTPVAGVAVMMTATAAGSIAGGVWAKDLWDMFTSDEEAGGAIPQGGGYQADLAAMLAWKMHYDMENKSYDSEYNTDEIAGNWDYIDLAANNGSGLTLSIDGTGLSLYDHQIVFGTSGDDIITGSGDSDRLYGLGGDDRINGGGGSDLIDGGEGSDILIVGNGDTVLDTQGRNHILLGNVELIGGKRVEGQDYYLDSRSGVEYRRSGADLIATLGGDQVTIRNYRAETSGIILDEEPDDPTPDPINEAIDAMLAAALVPLPRRGDPLVLDLDGDGIELVSMERSTAMFDLLSTDNAVRLGWVAPDDALLVQDLNGNGLIDDTAELFGDEQALTEAELSQIVPVAAQGVNPYRFATGFARLAA